MFGWPRLRQVALVAADCELIVGQLRAAFGWPEPYSDPGVGQFGLANAVFAAGDTFVEVVTPVRPGTAAGRYLGSRGDDSGYMAIFQLADLAEARRRVAAAGIRVVWSADRPDIAGTHLHPKDVPGAIVSLDWADPPQSWRWAGPAWTGRAPDHAPGGIRGLTIEVADLAAAAARWALVLGVSAAREPGAATITFEAARQDLRFVPVRPDRAEGIAEVRLATEKQQGSVEIAGVRFVSVAA